MENVMQQTADVFWKTHFPEFVGQTITERQALDDDFWGKLQSAYQASEPDTLWAVVLTNLPMRVEVTEMYSRIKTSAKRVWHKKTDPIYQNKR